MFKLPFGRREQVIPTQFVLDETQHGRGWAVGAETTRTLVHEEENLPTDEIIRQVGVFACGDGLCEGVCAHSYRVISQRFDLAEYEDLHGYVEGVAATLGKQVNYAGAIE